MKPFCLAIYGVLGLYSIPGAYSQVAGGRSRGKTQYKVLLGGSETDVLRERGGNGDWAGSLVACVLPYKMLLGCQKRACRARVVQQAA